MNYQQPAGSWKTKGLMLLSVGLMLMGCASGTTKIEVLKFDEEVIQKVKEKCTGTFSESSGGELSALWANKRHILRQSRDCSEAANILAGQAENRNRMIGN